MNQLQITIPSVKLASHQLGQIAAILLKHYNLQDSDYSRWIIFSGQKIVWQYTIQKLSREFINLSDEDIEIIGGINLLVVEQGHLDNFDLQQFHVGLVMGRTPQE